MSFKITIPDVPDKELGPIISRLQLPRGVTYDVKYSANGAEPPKKTRGSKKGNPHSRADSLLTMTGKTAQPKSIIASGMVIFEKLEKSMGIGTVKVKDFRNALTRNKLPAAVSQRCITEKFLTYIE